jgi:hypothetical protein
MQKYKGKSNVVVHIVISVLIVFFLLFGLWMMEIIDPNIQMGPIGSIFPLIDQIGQNGILIITKLWEIISGFINR